LDAAEGLFAARGFESVTMAQVGAAAGVSRGTPGYFFGSKDALYRAVLDRAGDELRAVSRSLRHRARGRGADAVTAAAIDAFLALAVARPSIVRLIDGYVAAGDGEPHADAVADALASLGPDADGVALTVLALCWFPVSQPGAARRLGVDPARPDFARTWRERVLAAVRPGVAPPTAPVPAGPPPAGESDEPRARKKKKKRKNKDKG
jgi:AcrR family transcriptional regulator